MKIPKSLIAWMICVSMFFLVPASLAGEEYLLNDGSRAVIVKTELILVQGKGKRSIAPPGHYETRDGRYTFIVRRNEVFVRDNTKVLR